MRLRAVWRAWGLGTAISLTTLLGGVTAEPPVTPLPEPLVPLYLPTDSAPITDRLLYDDALWGTPEQPGDRAALLQAIDHSLTYLATEKAAADYQALGLSDFTRDQVWRSLQRLRTLVLNSPNAAALATAIATEFDLYQSIGRDGQGSVGFTGYFEPVYAASRVPSAEYRYPLYRRPPDLDRWVQPHPTRLDLEGKDGLQASQGPLAGLELVWLRSRLEAFLVQVQGSARLQLPDGSNFSVGYAGRTEYPYTSLGRLLINDGKVAEEGLTLPVVLAYFEANPESLDTYLPQNQRFIFFRETEGGAPTGSLRVPVTAGRSIATDKTLMPPGAPALIRFPLPEQTATGEWQSRWVSRLVLDQDTGGAIQGPGRVDLFVGTGPEAGAQAGMINDTGQLFYLRLRQ